MGSDEENKRSKNTGVYLVAALVVLVAAPIAFFVTCNTVTEGVLRIAKPNARGEAYIASQIVYGLFLGIPFGLVAASFVVWFVRRKAEKVLLKSKGK